MDNDIINDIRIEKDFKNTTFSKFQKIKAKTELIDCIYNLKIENACYWCAEYICSGHLLELWDIIINYYCKYIHSGNPKLPIYLNMRYNNFINILNKNDKNLLKLRNNKNIRKLFAEIICILSFSNKKHIYQDVKLNKNEEFDITNISNKFKAPSIKYAENIFKEDDPKELFIPINELIYNLTNKNIIDCCYWYEWILEYENICKKKKKKCVCDIRQYAPDKNREDIIWMIWDVIFYYSDFTNELNDNPNIILINKIIKALFQLFIIKYNPSSKKKRKYIIYFCFALLIENINYDVNISDKSEEINAIILKIDSIYKEIKKNEIAPKMDYLYANINKYRNDLKLRIKNDILNKNLNYISESNDTDYTDDSD